MRIRGKKVRFGAEQINEVYGLSNANMIEFKGKNYGPRKLVSLETVPRKESRMGCHKNGLKAKTVPREANLVN